MRLAAIVFTLLSTAVFAEPSPHRATAVPMSESELDQVTAGAVTTVSVLLNSGNGGDPNLITDTSPSGGNKIRCHNCDLFGGSQPGPAQGFRLMINNGHPDGKIRCFGGFSSPGFC